MINSYSQSLSKSINTQNEENEFSSNLCSVTEASATRKNETSLPSNDAVGQHLISGDHFIIFANRGQDVWQAFSRYIISKSNEDHKKTSNVGQ